MSIQEPNLMERDELMLREGAINEVFYKLFCKQFVLSRQEGWGQQTGDKI